MRHLHLARAAIFARVAGLRECVIPLFGLWTWDGSLAIHARFDDDGLENRSLRCFREFGDGCFHKLILSRLVAWEICFTSGCETHERG